VQNFLWSMRFLLHNYHLLSSSVLDPQTNPRKGWQGRDGTYWLSDASMQMPIVSRFVITLPAGAVAKCCEEYVCVCVCQSVLEDISGSTQVIFTKFFVRVAYVRG